MSRAAPASSSSGRVTERAEAAAAIAPTTRASSAAPSMASRARWTRPMVGLRSAVSRMAPGPPGMVTKTVAASTAEAVSRCPAASPARTVATSGAAARFSARASESAGRLLAARTRPAGSMRVMRRPIRRPRRRMVGCHAVESSGSASATSVPSRASARMVIWSNPRRSDRSAAISRTPVVSTSSRRVPRTTRWRKVTGGGCSARCL